jgi:hypothetical protein
MRNKLTAQGRHAAKCLVINKNTYNGPDIIRYCLRAATEHSEEWLARLLRIWQILDSSVLSKNVKLTGIWRAPKSLKENVGLVY